MSWSPNFIASQVFGSTGDSEIIEFASPVKAEDSGFGIDVQDTL